MSLLFETICVKNGVPQHPDWHLQRMNSAAGETWPGETPFQTGLAIAVPPEFSNGIVRCKIHYGPGIHRISFEKYEKKVIRSLKIVVGNSIDYHLKFTDRTQLENLFRLRGSCDEIIIVKEGLITDTSVSNLVFFDGKNWVTPGNPLLKGTCRNRLIAEGKIVEKEIALTDLRSYKGCKLINAMRDMTEEEMIPVSQIY